MRLLALILLLAQEGLPEVPPRMAVDDEPTAMACTFDVALTGGRCAYEAPPAAGDPRDNSEIAAQAGARACAAAAKRDADLRKDCEKSVAEASLGPRCALATRLADTHGRLTPQAQDCVEAVRLAVSRTARAATVPGACCSCLGESRCGVPQTQCKRELAELTPGAALRSCISRSCEQECGFFAPAHTPEKETSPLPPRQNGGDKI